MLVPASRSGRTFHASRGAWPRGGRRTTDPIGASPSDRPGTGPGTAGATLVGASPDRRRLVRGLLGLSHRPVAHEAASLGGLPSSDPSDLLVVDVAGADPRWSELLHRTLAERPERPSLVLLPMDDPALRASATRAGARVILSYPFSTRDFADALHRATAAPAEPGSPTAAAPR